MSMTREQAIEILEVAIGEAYNLMQDRCCTQEETNETKGEMEQRFQALSILAPEPRKEPPTVEAFMLTPNAKGSSGLYVNEVWCGDLPNAEAYILVKRLTKALGMEGVEHD